MASYTILDADAHMSEPADLWTKRIEPRFLEVAPRIVPQYQGKQGQFFVFENTARRIGTELASSSKDMERPGGWDPAERLKDMEIDGIGAAVLYTTRGAPLFASPNAELQAACFRCYNDWLAEFCRYAPTRFAGLALISLFDVEQAARELARVHKLGLKGAMIWGRPPDDQPPYSSKSYDRFWAVSQDLGMPLSLHAGTRGKHYLVHTVEQEANFGEMYTSMIMRPADLQDSLLQLIFSGVFDRFPGLKVVAAEGDIHWVPGLMVRADKYYASRFKRGHDYNLSMLPSEFIRRNIWATFIKDELGLKVYQLTNYVDRVMWSTDYPHPACFFPHSLEILEKDFTGVPENDKRKMVHDNVAQLYGFPL